jgi:hypothetical protein
MTASLPARFLAGALHSVLRSPSGSGDPSPAFPLHSPHGGGSDERRGKVFGATLRRTVRLFGPPGLEGRGSDHRRRVRCV